MQDLYTRVQIIILHTPSFLMERKPYFVFDFYLLLSLRDNALFVLASLWYANRFLFYLF